MTGFFVIFFAVVILGLIACAIWSGKIEFSYLVTLIVAGIAMTSTIRTYDEGVARARCLEHLSAIERIKFLNFIEGTEEYGKRMTAFASLDAGDLVFGTDGEVYIVTKVHEPEGDTMPDVECRDLTLSSDIRIFIEGKDGWRYTTMKQEDELYRSTVTNVLVPQMHEALPLPHL